MKLKEWIAKAFIDSIPYIATNESANSDYIYNEVLVWHGNKTISKQLETIIDNEMNTDVLANIINNLFSKKWETLKKVNDANIELTGYTDTKTEQIDNSIYGYNGDSAKDYTNIKKTDETKTFNDLFTMIEKNIAMRQRLSYYKIVADDIASVLTTCVYED